MSHLRFVLVMAMAVVIWGEGTAQASIVIPLNLFNVSGYTGPYANATITRTDSTHASITFTSLTSSGLIYLFGDGGSVAVNVNAPNWAVNKITGTNSGTGFSPGPWGNALAGQEDGWGVFNITINSFDGYKSSSDKLTIELLNNGGTWASDSDVLVANALGHKVAAHIFATSTPANAKNEAVITGFASDGPCPVPEPATIAIWSLLGATFTGLAVVRRRRMIGSCQSWSAENRKAIAAIIERGRQ